MPTFDFTFTVDAPIAAVSSFHQDSRVLKTLTPPPVFVKVHMFEPLGEGSRSEFTLWFGPFPVHWVAIHSEVSERGFTDTQQRGPLRSWRHTHRFEAIGATVTRIHEHIEYEHEGGWRGLVSRLLFAKPGLYGLFTARKMITRRRLRRASDGLAADVS